jgi:hypothetical protein
MSECEPRFSESTFLSQAKGMKATEQYWKEVLEEMEKVSPGCTKSVAS